MKIVVKKNNDKKLDIDKQVKQKSIVVAKFGKTIGLEGKILIHSYFTTQSDILNFDKFSVDQKEDVLIQLEKKIEKYMLKSLILKQLKKQKFSPEN